MAAVVPYRDLRAALATVGAVLNRTNPPPWNGILITGDPGGTLTLTAASSSATVSIRLPGVARSAGRFLVDGWALTRMCTALVRGERRRDTDDQPVLLDGSDPAAPTVTIGEYTVPLTGLPADDHPGDCRPAPTIATVDGDALRDAVDRVLPAVGQQDTLPILTGIRLSLTPGRATVVATDRYRMAIDTLPATVTEPTGHELLVPGKALAACAERWTAPSVQIGRHRAESVRDVDRVTFSCGQITASLVELGEGYPSWRRLADTHSARHTATFDRAAVQAHVGRVLAILNAHPKVTDHIKIMTLTLTPDGLRVAPLLPEHRDRVNAPVLPATTSLTAGTMCWAFNVAYVRDALAALPFDTVMFSGQADADKSVLFTSTDGQAAEMPPYRHLLMPIRRN
ncbi:DNA polymerase III subunit beta [Frankia sp. R82]|uniref:DNA polymerase III subunit beta n=1 Tax=Frankia sp. R82 TaxID=2950553 RepID=UPI002043DC36|nr:DNA polymerase III subunit beta [Frankia sp. R82]MCM3883150.1 DNA polymerase III subunit beta [Frankia sp. R82]